MSTALWFTSAGLFPILPGPSCFKPFQNVLNILSSLLIVLFFSFTTFSKREKQNSVETVEGLVGETEEETRKQNKPPAPTSVAEVQGEIQGDGAVPLSWEPAVMASGLDGGRSAARPGGTA